MSWLRVPLSIDIMFHDQPCGFFVNKGSLQTRQTPQYTSAQTLHATKAGSQTASSHACFVNEENFIRDLMIIMFLWSSIWSQPGRMSRMKSC